MRFPSTKPGSVPANRRSLLPVRATSRRLKARPNPSFSEKLGVLGVVEYYGYRYYHTNLGRWLSRDPIGERGGLNLYAFVDNKPTLAFDMLGLKSESCSNCDEAIKRVINAPPYKTGGVAQVLWDTLKRKSCPAPKIKCECCTDQDSIDNGYYNRKTNEIIICCNNTSRPFSETIAHELVHALQRCQNYPFPGTKSRCAIKMCREVQPYAISGRCSGQEGALYTNCLVQTALISSAKSEDCKNETDTSDPLISMDNLRRVAENAIKSGCAGDPYLTWAHTY